ncbi:MAG: DUF5692 family protein [Gemmataceae bacterium]
MLVAFQVIALTVVLFLLQELLRHAGKWLLWTLFVAVPLALTPYWISINDFDPFVWIKIYSVCACVLWGVALRFTRLGESPLARLGIPLLLAGNIFEATVVDMLTGGLAHGLNVATGVLLIAFTPYGREDTQIATESRCRDAHLGLTRGWVIAYTLWNWTFVYLNYSAYIGQHTAVLLSAALVAAFDVQLWAQARACTLGLILIGMATFDAALLSWMDTSDWSNAGVGLAAAGIAFAFTTGYTVQRALNHFATYEPSVVGGSEPLVPALPA